MTQSDRVQLLKQTLPQQEYQASARDYVTYVSQTAIAIVQELQEVAAEQKQEQLVT